MDSDLNREMAAFEAARITRPIELEPARVGRILAVCDGSDQDPTVLALAGAAAAITGAELAEWRGDEDPAHEAILARSAAVDLLFAPCPFRADFADVGPDSLSTTLDVVLSRGRTPICLVRGPVDDPGACLRRCLVVLDLCRPRKVEATALALCLARGGGELALLAIVDPTGGPAPEDRAGFVDRYLHPESLSEDVLAALATARTAALTAALQKRAVELGVEPRIKLAAGTVVETALAVNAHRRGVLVGGLARDPGHPDFHHARALVLGSELPVLLV